MCNGVFCFLLEQKASFCFYIMAGDCLFYRFWNGKILNESIGFRADKKSSSEKHVNCSECDSFSLYPVASGMPYGN